MVAGNYLFGGFDWRGRHGIESLHASAATVWKQLPCALSRTRPFVDDPLPELPVVDLCFHTTAGQRRARRPTGQDAGITAAALTKGGLREGAWAMFEHRDDRRLHISPHRDCAATESTE